jgi:hypothetical protein
MAHWKPTELPDGRSAEGEIDRRRLLLLGRQLSRLQHAVNNVGRWGYSPGSETVNTAQWKTVAWNTEEADPWGALVTPGGLLTLPEGLYAASLFVSADAALSGAQIRVDGGPGVALWPGVLADYVPGGAWVGYVVFQSFGTQVAFQVRQTTGATRTLGESSVVVVGLS